MDYDEARDEIARLGLEAARLSQASGGGGSVSTVAGRLSAAMHGQGSRPDYSAVHLTGPPEDVSSLTASDLEDAASELARRTGNTYEAIWDAARSLSTGPSTIELSQAMATLIESTLGWDGYSGTPDDVIGLAQRIEADDTFGLAGAGSLTEGDIDYLASQEYIALSESGVYGGDQLVALASSLSAADRRELAAKGWALPDGSYPIPDRAHLHAAAVLCASHHGDVKAAKRLIRKRARELGVDLATLPGFGTDDGDDDADDSRRPTRRLVRSSGGTYESVPLTGAEFDHMASLAAELPDDLPLPEMATMLANLMEGGGDAGDAEAEVARLTADPEHAGYFGLVARRKGQTYLHTDEDTRDSAQPAKGGKMHPDVEKYLAMADEMFNVGKPDNGNRSDPPKPAAQRARESRRARPGHTGYGAMTPGGSRGTLMPS